MLMCPMYFCEYIQNHFTNSTVIPAVINISRRRIKDDLGIEFGLKLNV